MFKRRHPREGKTSKPVTWTTDKVPGGKVFTAWIAGPVEWVETHYLGISKPCCSIFTNGKVECQGCKLHKPVEWTGYCPLYNEDHKPLVVCLREHAQEVTDKLHFGDPVKVGRGKERQAPVWVRRSDWSGRFKSDHPERQRPADIRSWLLVLWKLPELSAYFGASTDQVQPEQDREDVIPLPETDLGVQVLRRIMEREGHRQPPGVGRTGDGRCVPLGECLPPLPSPSEAASPATNGKPRKKS